MDSSWRTLWLSDIHLGTAACRATELLNFLDHVSADLVYLTGDIVDLERMKARPKLPLAHRQVIGRLFALAGNGTRIVYIPGNHDRDLRSLAGRRLGNIEIEGEAAHRCAGGREMLVMHGDCFDRRLRSGSQAERIGAAAYQWLVQADAALHRLRSRFGGQPAPLSTRIKMRIRSASEYIRRFEESAARYARHRGFDGVVCGHIHRPALRQIDGTWYANDGDWVEHRSALAESADGRLQLLRWAPESVAVVPLPCPAPLAA